MEKRVKAFESYDLEGLEIELNQFLVRTPGKVHEILFRPIYDPEIDLVDHKCLVVYTPEGKGGEKDKTKKDEKSDERIQRGETPLWEQNWPFGRFSITSCCNRNG